MSINIVVGGEYRQIDNFIALPRRTQQGNSNEAIVDMLLEAGESVGQKIVYVQDPSKVYALSPFNYDEYSKCYPELGINVPRVYKVSYVDTIVSGQEVSPFTNEYRRIMKWIGLGGASRNLLSQNSSAVLPPEYAAIAPLFGAQSAAPQ
ncbi:MAG: hypothetical protein AABX51_03760 [Nanoarchaeota archaeon]